MSNITVDSGSRATQRRLPRQRRWLIKIMLLLVTCGMSLAVCELGTRLVAPQSASWLAIYRHHPELPFYALQPNARQTVDTGETHWSVVTNSQGDRVTADDVVAGQSLVNSAVTGPLPETWCLGDSFLFGHGVDHEFSFVGRLQQERAGDCEFVNAGVPGYGPVQYRQVWEYRLRHDPPPRRLLVATYLGNDFPDCLWNKDLPVTDGILGKRSSWLDTLKQRSHLYRLTARVYHQLVPHGDGAELSDGVEQAEAWEGEFLRKAEQGYREEFARIAERCQALDVELLVLVLPALEEVARIEAQPIDEPRPMSEARRRSRKILDDLQIRYVDLTEALCREPRAEVFFRFDGHLTSRGHEIVHDQIVRIIEGSRGAAPELAATGDARGR